MGEALLCGLGMDDHESRIRLIGYFESVLCFSRNDIITCFSDFIRCLGLKVAELGDMHTANHELRGRIDVLQTASLSANAELDTLRTRVLLSDTRASELSTINNQMNAALIAYKEKLDKYKCHSAEKDASISALRIEMDSYDGRLSKCLADASTADNLFSVRVKEMEIRCSRSLHRQRSLAKRVSFFRREMCNVKNCWTKWSRRSVILGGRCGCGQSVRYYEKSKIDLEWITEQATRASAGFQAEIESTTDRMRAEIQVVRDGLDDALADGSVYIDRLLRSEDDLHRSNMRSCELLNDLSVAKAEFARRGGSDRAFLRAQLFSGVSGRALVCPVPTVDGELVQLADVYRGGEYPSSVGRGHGLGAGFVSPLSGEFF